MKPLSKLQISYTPKIGGDRFYGLHEGMHVKVWQFDCRDQTLLKVIPGKPIKKDSNYMVVQIGGPGLTTTQSVCEIPKAMYLNQDMDAYIKDLFKHLFFERKATLRANGQRN